MRACALLAHLRVQKIVLPAVVAYSAPEEMGASIHTVVRVAGRQLVGWCVFLAHNPSEHSELALTHA